MTVNGQWRPAVNGTGKHPWFLIRESPEPAKRNYWTSNGMLVRYKSKKTAQRAADKLNRSETP